MCQGWRFYKEKTTTTKEISPSNMQFSPWFLVEITLAMDQWTTPSVYISGFSIAMLNLQNVEKSMTISRANISFMDYFLLLLLVVADAVVAAVAAVAGVWFDNRLQGLDQVPKIDCYVPVCGFQRVLTELYEMKICSYPYIYTMLWFPSSTPQLGLIISPIFSLGSPSRHIKTVSDWKQPLQNLQRKTNNEKNNQQMTTFTNFPIFFSAEPLH